MSHGGWLVAWAALLCGACQDFGEAPSCGPLAAPGCPAARGGTCDDEACGAIYACTESGWHLEQVCEREGGLAEGGNEASADAPVCGDAGSSLEGAVTGCDPNELRLPDCPVQVALGCPEQACISGCFDFFVCRTQGWEAVAYCDDVTGQLLWVGQ